MCPPLLPVQVRYENVSSAKLTLNKDQTGTIELTYHQGPFKPMVPTRLSTDYPPPPRIHICHHTTVHLPHHTYTPHIRYHSTHCRHTHVNTLNTERAHATHTLPWHHTTHILRLITLRPFDHYYVFIGTMFHSNMPTFRLQGIVRLDRVRDLKNACRVLDELLPAEILQVWSRW